MSKRIIITEEQFKIILNETLGIAKEVSKMSKELKKELFQHLETKKQGIFQFLDINVDFKKIEFDTDEDFYSWYDDNYQMVKNGYSFKNKTLFLTIIVINDHYSNAELNDTIQHELEHYYQTKMSGHTFSKPSYNNAYTNFNSYNAYIKYISRIEYFNHVEIDAYVNGAFYAAEDLDITTYDSFIEQTNLKQVKSNFIEAYNFFRNIPFKGNYFSDMILFIKQNGYYKNCGNLKMLREKICEKCKSGYDYFLKKSTRAYALIKMKEEEKEQVNADLFITKFKHYNKNGNK